MKIALIGATGYVGKAILAESLQRLHDVTAIVRNAAPIHEQPNLTIQAANIHETETIAKIITGHDVVITAFNAFKSYSNPKDAYDQQLAGAKSLLAAAKKANLKRVVFVGGAGSLKNIDGNDLVDGKNFPAQWHDMALAMRATLQLLKNETTLNWTMLSPSSVLEPGFRTGKFKLGKDHLIINEQGVSKISVEDFAYALLDEVEQPKHLQQRFTIGY
jgi:putative NADH-flavin reductase